MLRSYIELVLLIRDLNLEGRDVLLPNKSQDRNTVDLIGQLSKLDEITTKLQMSYATVVSRARAIFDTV